MIASHFDSFGSNMAPPKRLTLAQKSKLIEDSMKPGFYYIIKTIYLVANLDLVAKRLLTELATKSRFDCTSHLGGDQLPKYVL